MTTGYRHSKSSVRHPSGLTVRVVVSLSALVFTQTAAPFRANAQTTYQLNAAGLWTNGANWNGGVAPTADATGSVSIPVASGSFTMDLNSIATGQVIQVGSISVTAPAGVIRFTNGSAGGGELQVDKINVASGSTLTFGDRVSVSSVLLELNTAGGSGRIELQGGIGDRQLPSGALASGSLRVGGGVVVIQNSNIYSGSTELLGGATVAENDRAFSEGTITLHGGTLSGGGTGTRTLANAVSITGDVQLGQTAGTSLVLTGSVDLGGAPTRTLTILGNVEIQGEIKDAGGVASKLVKLGGGELTLSFGNSYSGGTEVQSGVLRVTADEALGGSVTGAGGGLTITGGTLDVGAGTTQTVSAITIRGGVISTDLTNPGALALSSATNPVIAANVAASAQIDAILSDDVRDLTKPMVSLLKTGAGILTLNGPNTYSGGTTLEAGVLILGNDSALGNSSGTVLLKGGVLSADALDRSIANPVTVAADVQLGRLGAGKLGLNGTVNMGGASRTLTVNGTVEIGGEISDGGAPAKLTKDGAGTLLLQNNNTYSGGTDLKAGVIETFADRALGRGMVSILDGELKLGASVLTVDALTVSGGNISSPSAPGAVLVVDSSTPAMIEANISGKATVAAGLADNPANAAVGLRKSGDGILYLNGDSSYRGDTLIQSGTVVIGADATATTGPLGAPSAGIVILAGGILIGDGAVSRDTGKVINVTTGFSRLGSDTTAIKVANTTIQSGATLETRGGVETGQMSVHGTWLLSGTDPVKVAQMEAASGALLIWNKPMASTAIVVTSPGGVATDLHSAQVSVGASVAQGVQNLKEGTVVGTLVQSTGTLVSPNSVVQPAGRVRFRLDLHPAVGAAPGVIELVVDRNEIERDGGRAFAGLSALWSRRGTAMDEPLMARMNALAAVTPLGPALSMGVRVRPLASKTVIEPEKVRFEEDRELEAWVAGYGARNHVSEDAAGGFGSAQSTESAGAFGLERQVGDARGGFVVVIGQGEGRVSDPSSRVDSDYWGVGGYGSVRIGAVTLDASAMWGRNDQESTRETLANTAKAKFSADEIHAGIGMTLNLTDARSAWQVAPVARLQYVNIEQGAFEEQGGSFPAAFGKIRNDRLLSKVGLRIGRHGLVSTQIDLGVDGAAYWVHDYTSNGKAIPYRVGTSSFTVAGRNLVSDSAMFDLGLQATFSDKLTLGVRGHQQVGGDQYQTTGLFSVGVKF